MEQRARRAHFFLFMEAVIASFSALFRNGLTIIFELGDHFSFFDKEIANLYISLMNRFFSLILFRGRHSLWAHFALVL
jgi:hypothetical protein